MVAAVLAWARLAFASGEGRVAEGEQERAQSIGELLDLGAVE
ncbi:hypothetical protein AB0M22_28045 [Nocardia sp. NPDC051756]